MRVTPVVEAALRAGGVVSLAWLMSQDRGRASWPTLGFDFKAKRIADALGGWLFGCALIAIVFALEVGLGWRKVVGYESAPPAQIVAWVSSSALMFVAVGVAEEVALRGYVFQNMATDSRLSLRIFFNALIFGVMHAHIRGFGIHFMIAMLPFTAICVVSRLARNSLWFPIGFHGGWDWMQSHVLGLSTTGAVDYEHSVVHLMTAPAGRWTSMTSTLVERDVASMCALFVGMGALLLLLRRFKPRALARCE